MFGVFCERYFFDHPAGFPQRHKEHNVQRGKRYDLYQRKTLCPLW